MSTKFSCDMLSDFISDVLVIVRSVWEAAEKLVESIHIRSRQDRILSSSAPALRTDGGEGHVVDVRYSGGTFTFTQRVYVRRM